MKEKDFLDELIELIKSRSKIDKLPIEVYSRYTHRFKTKPGFEKFKILILNAPCNGFGDVVFGMKLRNYLTGWYNIDIKIASTKVDNFKTLGEKDENLYKLKGGKSDQCRRFRNLNFVDTNGDVIDAPKADLILVAPMQMDFDSDYSDVKSLIPYSNRYNTYFFSEYNDSLRNKTFDFNTGIGKGRMGLLFTNTGKTKRISSLKNSYVVVYIAESVDRSKTCFMNFVDMVTKKYSEEYKKFDIVVPPWIGKDLNEDSKMIKKLVNVVKKYYNEINVVTKNESFNLYEGENKYKNILTIRADILPLSYDLMKSLFVYSEREILVTGDQSITDVLSCCWKDKLPMYQIVPWKKDFSKELASHLPQKFLKHITTSCGSLKAINYNPSFEKFMKSWDFRKLAKPKMDAIIAFNIDSKTNPVIQEVKDIFLTSRSKRILVDKLYTLKETIIS